MVRDAVTGQFAALVESCLDMPGTFAQRRSLTHHTIRPELPPPRLEERDPGKLDQESDSCQHHMRRAIRLLHYVHRVPSDP